MAGQLADKVVIVTGAARGLGRECARRLAVEQAAVVAADIRDCSEVVAEITAAGGRAVGMNLDVTDMRSCISMAQTAVESFGRIDALVNNAALYGGLRGGPFDKLDEQEWDRVLAVNVTGIWHCCKAVVPHMRERGAGSIINMSSAAAIYGLPYSLHYTVSKGAVIALTRGLARELGRDWIRVNAIAPSAVMTEGTKEFYGERLDKAAEAIAKGQALRRNLLPGDISGTIIYLASDASALVTGQTIMVDGGTVFL